ncbi:MAG: hypothetical protein CL613_09660 [Aquimarina sp.]|nr:hypothetical protein [Aquimarina sp.]
MKNLSILALIVLLSSCNTSNKKTSEEPTTKEDTLNTIPVEPDGGIGDGAFSLEKQFLQNIESAHKKPAFLDHKMITFDAVINFNGKTILDAKITMLTNSSKIRIDKKDGTKLIYNGDKVMLCPKEASDKRARFDMFTWSYFFALPYKLSDPGTALEVKQDRSLDGENYATAKLTFDKGTGDAPDDWYIVYVNPENNVVTAAAYIVTYGSGDDISKAESDPHMIVYKDYALIDNIPISTQWDFYSWTDDKGKTEKLGEAMISDVVFLEENATLFEEPDDYKEITLK